MSDDFAEAFAATGTATDQLLHWARVRQQMAIHAITEVNTSAAAKGHLDRVAAYYRRSSDKLGNIWPGQLRDLAANSDREAARAAESAVHRFSGPEIQEFWPGGQGEPSSILERVDVDKLIDSFTRADARLQVQGAAREVLDGVSRELRALPPMRVLPKETLTAFRASAGSPVSKFGGEVHTTQPEHGLFPGGVVAQATGFIEEQESLVPEVEKVLAKVEAAIATATNQRWRSRKRFSKQVKEALGEAAAQIDHMSDFSVSDSWNDMLALAMCKRDWDAAKENAAAFRKTATALDGEWSTYLGSPRSRTVRETFPILNSPDGLNGPGGNLKSLAEGSEVRAIQQTRGTFAQAL